ncbi:MAG: sigma-54 dependent transcriptional regulator [Myxococcales bacterium]|nr:sigma-54 dependent transcriptional regulator [Myxococcales bacterium]
MAPVSPSTFRADARPGHVLVVDDDPAFREFVVLELQRLGFTVHAEGTVEGAAARLSESWDTFDVVLSDLNLGRGSGLDLVRQVTNEQWPLPIVMLTGFGTIDAAVSAIRDGAYDFLTKPFEAEVMALTLQRAVEVARLKRELIGLRDRASRRVGSLLVGESAVVKKIHELIHRLAPTDTTVLVTGESGTGKELVARALHLQSRRASGPFLPINCGAMPEHLLESELFGHVRGAFTDARADRHGVFREANGGTLFLDEVGELPLALQPKLLRVLQERTVRPVGSNKELNIDVRIVAATNVDLQAAVERGAFREDLYYRLDVVSIDLPPLRARGKDVLLLAQRFLASFAARDGQPVRQVSPEAAAMLMQHAWPGNVRELHNALERAVTISTNETLMIADFPDRLRARAPVVQPDATDASTMLPLSEVERRYIVSVLEQLQGNKRRAAQVLGLDRSTLYRRLKEFGLSGADE